MATLLQCPSVVLNIFKLSSETQNKPEAHANSASKDGLTPLHVASMVDNQRIAHILVENGASIMNKDRSGRTAVYWAAVCSSMEVLDYLSNLEDATQHGLINAPDVDSASPLHVALRKQNVRTAERLVELGADIYSRTASGQSPLHYAVRHAPDATSMLLQRGALLQETSSNGRNALLWACVLGDKKCVSTLLQANTDICVKDNIDATPLHLLVQFSPEPLNAAKLLLEHGALPDEADTNGVTPLHISIERRHFAVAELLLLRGANAKKTSILERSVLQIAASHPDCPDRLWALLGDVNTLDKNGQGALHLAAKSQRITEVENLLAHGADTELRNTTSETALHLAIRHFVKGRHQSRNLDELDLRIKNE